MFLLNENSVLSTIIISLLVGLIRVFFAYGPKSAKLPQPDQLVMFNLIILLKKIVVNFN